MSRRVRFVVPASAALVVAMLAVAIFPALAAMRQGANLPPPVELTAEQDHQRLMDLLGIKSIRPGADPRNLRAPNAVNYDEAKANPYATLPDPLVLKNGRRVTSARTWWSTRRPEIVEDFDREVYGRVPKQTPRVRWEVTSTASETVGGIPVNTKKLAGHADTSKYPAISVNIQFTLTTPANARGPVPVMIEFGFSFPAGAGRAERPSGPPPAAGPTWQEQLLARGWGYATLSPTSVQADNGAGLTRGIIGLANKGQPRKIDDWGALRAWAWGASRALDYLETDRAVNAKQVGIEGLSRYGKAALVTMAYDPRFAIAFVASSGEGGAKLHRRQFGELVENVAGTGEYHWMAGSFIKYAGPLTANDLPVDSHELIALCAPRPVFISAGSFEVEGGWVDAKGMFMAAAAAGPVYRLLGKKDLGATEFPPIETALVSGEIAFRQHRGGHTAGPNWPTFLAFADRYITAPRVADPGPSKLGPVSARTRNPAEAGSHGSAASTPGESTRVGAAPSGTIRRVAPTTSMGGGEPLTVALTFDDLPVHGTLPPGVRRPDIAKGILAALQAHKVPPTYGFVNAKGLEEAPDNVEVLRLWRAAGHPLANHTFSHMDLNANSPEAFEQDIVANEATLRTFMGGDGWRWLRFPYLRQGDTPEKWRAVASFLKERGYRVAHVTISFDDYAYNDPYARCLARPDPTAVDWMRASFLERAARYISASQESAKLAFGRDIPHVMLLHLGAFDVVMLPALLDLMEQRKIRFVTLEEAQGDAAYSFDPELPSASGSTFLDRMIATRRVAAVRPAADDTLSRLANLCR